ncbi:MAG: autotransporter outer membrane beta-barrel domain-containing protein [Pseudomonadota bacterium]
MAFLWTEESGLVRLSDVLAEAGVDMTGVKLASADAISADGDRIVGTLERQGQTDGYIAVLSASSLAGLLGLADFSSSVEGISEISGSATALSLRGAGDLMFGANSFRFAPGSTDVASLDWSGPGSGFSVKAFALGQGVLGFSEDASGASGAIGVVGGHHDLGLSAGLALQGQYITQTGGQNDSEATSDAIGPAAFVRYAPGESGLSLTATANYGVLNADIERRYSNGAAVETAMGETDGFSVGGEAQVGWRFAFGGDVTVMPYAAYQIQHVELDAYDESGATFTGRMSGQETTIRKAKLGLMGGWQVHPDVRLSGSVEFAHVDEDVSNASLNVAALGTGSFGGTGGDRDYGLATVGIGASYSVNDRVDLFGAVDVTKALRSAIDDQDHVGLRLGISIELF